MHRTRIASLTGDTLILTAEGPRLLESLADSQAQTLVYALHRTGNAPVLRWMRGVRLTRQDAPVIEITFDSGLVVRCTHDHLWIAPDGSTLEAASLAAGSRLRGYKVPRKLEPSFALMNHRVTSVREAGRAYVFSSSVHDVATWVIADPETDRSPSAYTGVVAATRES